MTPTEFESIKTKMNKLELDAASSKGKIESIESGWKKKYGFTSLEDAKKKRDELNKESLGLLGSIYRKSVFIV